MTDIKALRAAMSDEEDGAAWIAGKDLMRKEALGGALPDNFQGDASSAEDTRSISVKELVSIKDPEERKRYMCDMSAKNHRTAMEVPPSFREATATQKTASFTDKMCELIKGSSTALK